MDGIERSAEENDVTSQFAELQVDPSSLQSQTTRELREKIAAGERQAGTRLGITRTLIRQTAAQADSLSANALRKAWSMLGAALLGFAAWLAFCVLVRRSVIRPLMALTGSAQQVVEASPGSRTTSPPAAPRSDRRPSRCRSATTSVSWPRRSTMCRSPPPRCWRGKY